MFLAASSSLKGQSDKEKYEKSRKLKVSMKTSYNEYHFRHIDLIPVRFLLEKILNNYEFMFTHPHPHNNIISGTHRRHQSSLHQGFCQ